MTKQTEALKLALEALREIERLPGISSANLYARRALKEIEALALVNFVDQEQPAQDDPDLQDKDPELVEQPAQQEPVAFVKGWNCGRLEVIVRSRNQTFEIDQPLYTSPQPAQQEPVAKVYRHGRSSNGTPWHGVHWFDEGVNMPDGTLLYTAPQAQRTWVGLTDEEIYEMADNGVFLGNIKEISRDIEAKLREKNSGDQK